MAETLSAGCVTLDRILYVIDIVTVYMNGTTLRKIWTLVSSIKSMLFTNKYHCIL